MNAFTKFLIVLVSVFTIALCPLVVVYVATATNYKEAYQDRQTEIQSLKSQLTYQKQQLTEKSNEAQRIQDQQKEKIRQLMIDKNQLSMDLENAKRTNLVSSEKVNNMAGVIESLNQTIADMENTLKATRSELDSLRTEQVKDNKKINDLTATLDQKIVQLQNCQDERKRLVEEKVGLEKMLAFSASNVQPVTQVRSAYARQAPTLAPMDVPALKGLISEVDIAGKLATITLGTADGVQKGMVFHIIRGDQFIANLRITHVDSEQAAGTLEMQQQNPRVGDTVSTEL